MKYEARQFRVSSRAGSVRELVVLAAPLVLAHMSQSMMWVVDTFLMKWVGTVEQGAVGLSGIMFWAVACLFAGTMTAISVLVAQDYGAGKSDLARHVRTGLVLVVPMALIMMWIGTLVGDGLVLTNISDQARPHAEGYLRIRFYGAPLILVSFALSSFLRGIGDTVTPMIAAITANVCNVIVALVLVFGYLGFEPMGVAGAAWATVVASGIEAAIYVGFYIFGASARSHGSRKVAVPGVAEIRQFLLLGVPMGVAWLFETVAWAAFSAYAGSRPPEELAAHSVLFQVCGFCFMPSVAFSIAATILVGQYLGANRIDLARKSAVNAAAVGALYMLVVGIALGVFRHPLMALFNNDPAVVAMGATVALLAALYQPFDGFAIVAQGIMRGAKQTTMPTLIMLGSGFFMFIPLVWYLGDYRNMGIVGAWMAAVAHVVLIASLLALAVARSRVFRGRNTLVVNTRDVHRCDAHRGGSA
ncbi:MAG: MATE family efflux transporter [Polyangiaceae bacterium]|nr:MATE family efflux transporter [Polyangiaceae bacterium]